MLLWTLIALACVGVDLLTKQLVIAGMELYDSIPLLPGIIELRYIRNEGAAWGIFSEQRWIFMALSAVAIIALPLIIYKFRKAPFLFGFSLSLILGGAIGNMIDRIFYGSVVDFLNFQFIEFPVFNAADCFVTVGAVLMFVYIIFLDKTIIPDDKKKTLSAEDETNDKA